MAKTKTPRRDDYPPSQAAKRRDDALRAALSMPPTPHDSPARKPAKRKRKKAPP